MDDYENQNDDDDFAGELGDDDLANAFLREAGFNEDLSEADAPSEPGLAEADQGGEGDAGVSLADLLGADLLGGDLLAGGLLGEASPDDGDLFNAGDDATGDQLAWRETYVVIFGHNDRPTLTQVEGALADADPRLKVENLQADEDGLFQSLLVQAPEDNAALEISYEAGEAVIEQSCELAKEMQKQIDGDQLALLLRGDARLDIMHFERIQQEEEHRDEDDDALLLEALDPATLITVVEALANLTGGLPIDPAAGELLA